MKCPECQKDGEKSKVYVPTCGMRTLMGWQSFWDEDGNYHSHDLNTTTTIYSCSRGHEWTVKSKDPCQVPGCEWAER